MGSITMADQTPRYRSYDYDVDIPDKTLIDRRVAPYKFGQSARTDSHAEDPVPLFLSDYDGEPDPSEYMTPLRKDRRLSVSSRILAGVLATAAVAVLFAMFSSDATRDIIVNAKASIAASLPAPYAAAQRDPAQLTARDTQLKNPNDAARLSAPASQTPGVRSVTTVAVAPTREEITTAYQSALQSRALAATPPAATPPAAPAPVAAAPPAAAPVAAPPPAPVPELLIPGDAIRHLDPNEIASSLRRADDLIASGDLAAGGGGGGGGGGGAGGGPPPPRRRAPPTRGDLAAARLVLRRAANAGDAHAAMRLAGTYDPVILEKLGVHGFVPDVAMARVWYEKAKKFGSAEAPQRLELLASKRQ
jgi:TPR repeat protein